jgi:hemerythrin
MALIQWSGALYIDNQEINNQHFRFVMILNELYESILWAEGDEIIRATLDRLEEYADQHFSFEEALMEKFHSPLTAAHKEEHGSFRNKIKEMRGELLKGIQTLDMELSAYLNGWMVNHIQGMDKETFSQISESSS